jgi:hypothetical protein
VVELDMSCTERTVSMDRLREPDSDVRRRFRDEWSLSSNGLGLVEEGSEETARSLGSGDLEAWSIGMVQGGYAAQVLELQRRHTVARDGSAAAAQR